MLLSVEQAFVGRESAIRSPLKTTTWEATGDAALHILIGSALHYRLNDLALFTLFVLDKILN